MDEDVITLSVTHNYAQSWGVWEGVRELVQNWIDGIYSTASGIEDLPLDSAVEVRKIVCGEEYVAVVKDTLGQEIILGMLAYDKLTNALRLTNCQTTLTRKVLLIGYSSKADHSRSIGQFGEGLKIGALALARNGHLVTVETGSELWMFDLMNHEQLEAKVLSIRATERIKEEPGEREPSAPKATDTVVVVKPLDGKLWMTFVKRFLFLSPPEEAYRTNLGSLLLDSSLCGQLFIRGIWVNDMKGDLWAGADFLDIPIDRDRKMVTHPSDIDHQICTMWVKVIEKHPELAQRYYAMLKKDKFRDVRRSVEHFTKEAADFIHQMFVSEHGLLAFPMPYTSSPEDLSLARTELQKTVVLCNESLHAVLMKSGHYACLADSLQEKLAQASVLPFTAIHPEQQAVLLEGLQLARLATQECVQLEFDVLNITLRDQPCQWKNSRIQIPVWMLSKDAVHKVFRVCSPPMNASADVSQTCKCCQAHLCLSVLQQLPVGRLVSMAMRSGNVLLPVLSSLASQVCGKVEEAFCYGSHIPDQRDGSVVEVMKQRELDFSRRIEECSVALEAEREQQGKSVAVLRTELKKLQDSILAQELKCVDASDSISRRYEEQMRKYRAEAKETISNLEKTVAAKEESLMYLQENLQHKDKTLKKLRQELRDLSEPLEKRSAAIMDELSEFIRHHQKTMKNLRELCQEKVETQDEDAQRKLGFIKQLCDVIIPELQSEKVVCTLCRVERKSQLLLPCGHYVACKTCALKVLQAKKCPVCRDQVTDHVTVFE